MPEGLAVAGLARCHEVAGEMSSARERYADVLAIGRRVGEPGLTSTALEGLGRLAAESGDVAEAHRLLVRGGGAAPQLGQAGPAPRTPRPRGRHRSLVHRVGHLTGRHG